MGGVSVHRACGERETRGVFPTAADADGSIGIALERGVRGGRLSNSTSRWAMCKRDGWFFSTSGRLDVDEVVHFPQLSQHVALPMWQDSSAAVRPSI